MKYDVIGDICLDLCEISSIRKSGDSLSISLKQTSGSLGITFGSQEALEKEYNRIVEILKALK